MPGGWARGPAAAIRLTAVLGLSVVGALVAIGHEAPGDPLSFFSPTVILNAADRQRLAGGEIVTRILPGRDGQLAVFAASRLDASPDLLAAWTRRIEDLKQGPFVASVRRFSDPPVLSDLDELTLDDHDLEAIRECRLGDCELKLAAVDIEALKHAAAEAGPAWKQALQRAFRELVFDRLALYRSAGLAGLPPYVDRAAPVQPEDRFVALLNDSSYLRKSAPALAARLEGRPHALMPDAEGFFYWSKEAYGGGRRVISVTHVEIARVNTPGSEMVVVAGKEIFATHYKDASLGITAAVRSTGTGGGYLLYLNRTDVDALGGLLGGLKRLLIERRIKNEAPVIIRRLRDRFNGGGPDARTSAPGFPHRRERIPTE